MKSHSSRTTALVHQITSRIGHSEHVTGMAPGMMILALPIIRSALDERLAKAWKSAPQLDASGSIGS